MAGNIEMTMNLKVDTSEAQSKIQNLASILPTGNGQNASFAQPSSMSSFVYSPSNVNQSYSPTPLNPNFRNQFEQQRNTSDSLKKISDSSIKFAESLADATTALTIFAEGLKNSPTNPNSPASDPRNPNKPKNEPDQKDKYLASTVLSGIAQYMDKAFSLISIYSKGNLAYTQHAVTGDVVGANFAKTDSNIGLLKTGGSTLMSAGMALAPFTGGLSLIGSGVGLAMEAGGSIWDYSTDREKESHAFVEEYKKALPQLTSVGMAFGGEGIRNKSAEQNSKDQLNDWARLNETYNRGTGMDNAAFTQLATSLSQQGVTNLDQAGSMANAAARWARFAGGDASQYADFMGKMTRYGSKNAENDLGYAYSAAKNSGLSKTQMPEFLSGLQTVIENGISKGYVRSTKDVADTLSMFGKMTGGNVAWTGQQGAQKLMSMDTGLANAASLQDPAQIVAFKALRNNKAGIEAQGNKNGWYDERFGAYNTLAYMEDGADPSKIKDVWKGISNTYAGDYSQQIEAVKKVFGLNNIGAMQFIKAAGTGDFVEAKNVTETASNKNNESKLFDALSQINSDVVKIGSIKFPDEYRKIIDYVKEIRDKLLGTENPTATASTTLATTTNINRVVDKIGMEKDPSGNWRKLQTNMLNHVSSADLAPVINEFDSLVADNMATIVAGGWTPEKISSTKLGQADTKNLVNKNIKDLKKWLASRPIDPNADVTTTGVYDASAAADFNKQPLEWGLGSQGMFDMLDKLGLKTSDVDMESFKMKVNSNSSEAKKYWDKAMETDLSGKSGVMDKYEMEYFLQKLGDELSGTNKNLINDLINGLEKKDSSTRVVVK